jgi:hypothetical protein
LIDPKQPPKKERALVVSFAVRDYHKFVEKPLLLLVSGETMSDDTHYTVLGISETATQYEIDRAHRSLIEAYDVLSDSTRRSSYDQQLAQHRKQNAPAPTAPPKTAGTAPPSYTSLPSAQPQQQVGKRDIEWWDLAPLVGVLFVLAPWCMLVVFDSDLVALMSVVSLVLTVIVLARWSSAFLWSLFH